MTRALVVHHDIDLADQEVESLRRFGYQVEQCSGPTANACPVLNGGTCELAARSDVLVYDAWASGDTDGSGELIEGLRRVHPTRADRAHRAWRRHELGAGDGPRRRRAAGSADGGEAP